jgi:hypothetical protein
MEIKGNYMISRTNQPVCPKCQGAKWYPIRAFDNNTPIIVEVICELCCTHDKGFIQITHPSFGMLVGKYTCKIGCGLIINTLAKA